MLNPSRHRLALTGALLLASHTLFSHSTELDLELAAGYAWDDNVGLDELERATGESDELTTLEAQGSALFTYQDRASLRLSAGLVDDSYQKFSQVDRRTESLGVNLEAQLGKATVGINWFDVSAELDNEQFLTYERLSPYVNTAFTSRLTDFNFFIIYCIKITVFLNAYWKKMTRNWFLKLNLILIMSFFNGTF